MWEGRRVRKCALARPERQKYACTPSPLSIFTPHTYSLSKFSLAPTLQLPNPRWRPTLYYENLHSQNSHEYKIRTFLIQCMSEIQESMSRTSVYDTLTYFSHMLCRTPQYSVGVANHSESPGPMLIFIA